MSEPISMDVLRGLERKIKEFLNCGWVLEYYEGTQEYVLSGGPANQERYSSLELSEENEIYTSYEFNRNLERDGAMRILKFIVEHEPLVHSEMNPYKKFIKFNP
jgi:hypothetical protein